MSGQIYQEDTFDVGSTTVADKYFFPFKMQQIEVFNLGANDVKVMLNDAGTANGITVYAGGYRAFNATRPGFSRIGFLCTAGVTIIRMVGTR